MLFWLNVCSEGGKFNIHSMDEFVNWVIIIFFFSIIEDQIIKIIKPTPISLITDPIDEIMFHFEKKSG